VDGFFRDTVFSDAVPHPTYLNPEDGGNMFLRSVGGRLQVYTIWTIIRLLTFETLSIVLFFYLKWHFGDWSLLPSSGEKPVFLCPVGRADPCLRTLSSRWKHQIFIQPWRSVARLSFWPWASEIQGLFSLIMSGTKRLKVRSVADV
jgi:hypothetical protein